jgi:hypothetical protein
MYILSRHQQESPEEQQLKKAIVDLRLRLQITAADGFLLTSERNSGLSLVCWRWQTKQPVIIQRSFVEAAARLSLFQDFDIHQLDAFCICLRCSRGENENLEHSAPPVYYALCDWLLEICKALIRPALEGLSGSECNTSSVHLECNLPVDERFPYFQKRVCRARLWSDMGGLLFQRLRQAAQARASALSYFEQAGRQAEAGSIT